MINDFISIVDTNPEPSPNEWIDFCDSYNVILDEQSIILNDVRYCEEKVNQFVSDDEYLPVSLEGFLDEWKNRFIVSR